jgi:DNA-binding MarR family transcriptional regulator
MDRSQLAFVLATATALVTRRYDRRLSAHGISFSDLAVLRHLDAAPEKRLRRVDLAERAAMSPSGVTRMLMPLEKIGLVSREPNPRDARVAFAALTPAGERVVAEAMASAIVATEDAFDRLSDDEVASLASMLGRLAA